MLGEYIDHQRACGFSFWAVIERRSGELIGDAGLYSRDGEVELGYTLSSDPRTDPPRQSRRSSDSSAARGSARTGQIMGCIG
jgi:hypothetical protein